MTRTSRDIVKSHDLLGPGAYLQRVREDAGLSMLNVIDRLKIGLGTLHYFERDIDVDGELLPRWRLALYQLINHRRKDVMRAMKYAYREDIPGETYNKELYSYLKAVGYGSVEIGAELGGTHRVSTRAKNSKMSARLRFAARDMLATRLRMIDIHREKLLTLLEVDDVKVPDSQR